MRRLELVAITIALVVLIGLMVGWPRAPAPGPLQPTDVVNSFSKWAGNGLTLSLVVQFRAERAATATLQGLSLAAPDAGLTLVDSGILVDGYPGTYTGGSFPLGTLRPIAGTTITTVPGEPGQDIFFNLGIRVAFDARNQLSMGGVWLDYSVSGTNYRALLPWLLTVCENPPGLESCPAREPSEFSFPPLAFAASGRR